MLSTGFGHIFKMIFHPLYLKDIKSKEHFCLFSLSFFPPYAIIYYNVTNYFCAAVLGNAAGTLDFKITCLWHIYISKSTDTVVTRKMATSPKM